MKFCSHILLGIDVILKATRIVAIYTIRSIVIRKKVDIYFT
jgi:hypothetical protein